MTEYELFFWAGLGIGAVIAISQFVVLPFLKEVGKQNKKAQAVQASDSQELNVKNITNLAGGAAANYVENMLKNLEQGYQQAKDVYTKQQAECARQGIDPAKAEAILAPLRAKMKQAEWLLQNRQGLEQINKALTAPVIGGLAKKILGGLI